jgi:O-antigen ligase
MWYREIINRLNLQGDYRTLPTQAGILTTFFLVPMWYRFKNAPPSFTVYYVTGFVILIPMLWSMIWWFALGMPGFKALRKDTLRAGWILALLLLTLLMFASGSWAFMRELRPELSVGTGLQFGLVALFVLCVACTAQPKWVIGILVAGLIPHGAVGGLQALRQSSLGLHSLGEFYLDPQQIGISVIRSGESLWLRPYGLTSHPNMYAGFLVSGILAAVPLIVSSGKIIRWLGTVALLFGLSILFLTFSRSAWLGLFCGMLLLWVLLARYYRHKRFVRWHVIAVSGAAILLALIFIARFTPFLLARAGVQQEAVELRSLEERAVLIHIALTVIDRYPLQGVGAGNFPWYATYYLHHETDLEMRRTTVHNVYLSAYAELGVLGIALQLIGLGSGVLAAFRHPQDEMTVHRYALLSGFFALAVIGLFDHYPWTIVHFQVLWFGLLAVSSCG